MATGQTVDFEAQPDKLIGPLDASLVHFELKCHRVDDCLVRILSQMTAAGFRAYSVKQCGNYALVSYVFLAPAPGVRRPHPFSFRH